MRIAGWLTEKQIGGCLVLMLAAPTARAAAMPRQDEATVRQEQSAPNSEVQKVGTDNGNGKPTADSAQSGATLPDAPEVAQLQSSSSNGQNGSLPPGQDQQQKDAAQPVGTAAAPNEMASGVMASKPAGAAIAPAKQRRVRTFMISLGVVAATCVAIGIVAGLSRTSPSKP